VLHQAVPAEKTADEGEELQSVFAPPAIATEDDRAKKEALMIGGGLDLEADGKKQEHTRHQSFRNAVNTATIILFWVIASCLLVGILTYVWHMITPKNWQYLDKEQLGELKTILVTAITSSALTQYVKKRMD